MDHTDESWVAEWESGHLVDNDPVIFDFSRMLDTTPPTGGDPLWQMINQGEVTELWLWGDPTSRWDERNEIGGPLPTFGLSHNHPDDRLTRRVAAMGYNFSGQGPGLHSYGHRTEEIIGGRLGGWNAEPWSHFRRLEYEVPGEASVGNVHYSFNALVEGRLYDYATRRYVWTDADDWFHFPEFTGEKDWRGCTVFGCEGMAYLRWWFAHLPRGNGTNGNLQYNYNNWWPLIAHPYCQPPWTP